ESNYKYNKPNNYEFDDNKPDDNELNNGKLDNKLNNNKLDNKIDNNKLDNKIDNKLEDFDSNYNNIDINNCKEMQNNKVIEID
ncbi:26033_t:CDS:1, partial [Racocetra persica]